jgi:DNA-binding IclR family transcriptional regulator
MAEEQKVEAVERGLTILNAFSDGKTHLSLADLANRTGLYRSTILRLSASLERFGYLHRDEDGLFRLGPTLWRLGVLYQNAFNLADYVRPSLRELVDDTGETAAFYIREGNKRICLYRQHSARLIRHHLEEGAELPLDRGASARVLMAYTDGTGDIYDRVRSDGFYVSMGERDPETAAIAAPVFGQERHFVGAIGVTGPKSRFGDQIRERIATLLVEKARLLSKAIGGH